MRRDLFDFEVPERHVALRPAEPRESARLLVIREGGAFEDCRIRDLPLQLPQGIAVLNDTKVIAARLFAQKETGGRVEVFLLRSESSDSWRVLLHGKGAFKENAALVFSQTLTARVRALHGKGEASLRFSSSGEALHALLEKEGKMPLPPYIEKRRAADERDRKDYQTLYAKERGAVAAPTAGLHITPTLLQSMEEKGMEHAFLTLHTGLGTFSPVREQDVRCHRMHAEEAYLPEETAARVNHVKSQGGAVLAVGTTSLRLLETAGDDASRLRSFSGETDLFILPGYSFKVADILLTNFHQPASTLFMLVAAFGGLERMKAAYDHAMRHHYRFYSYGDACLIFREKKR